MRIRENVGTNGSIYYEFDTFTKTWDDLGAGVDILRRFEVHQVECRWAEASWEAFGLSWDELYLNCDDFRDIWKEFVMSSEHSEWWLDGCGANWVICVELSWIRSSIRDVRVNEGTLGSKRVRNERIGTILGEENGVEIGTRCILGFREASRLLIA